MVNDVDAAAALLRQRTSYERSGWLVGKERHGIQSEAGQFDHHQYRVLLYICIPPAFILMSWSIRGGPRKMKHERL